MAISRDSAKVYKTVFAYRGLIEHANCSRELNRLETFNLSNGPIQTSPFNLLTGHLAFLARSNRASKLEDCETRRRDSNRTVETVYDQAAPLN